VFFTNEEYQTSLLMNGSVKGPGQSVLVLTLSICGGQSGWAKLGEEVVNSNQLWPPIQLLLMVAAVHKTPLLCMLLHYKSTAVQRPNPTPTISYYLHVCDPTHCVTFIHVCCTYQLT